MDLSATRCGILTVREAMAIWSGISEPSDIAVSALIQELGPVDALQWAGTSYRSPGRISEQDTGWWRIHERLAPRIAQFDLAEELHALDRVGGRLLVPGDDQWPTGFQRLGAKAPRALWLQGRIPIESQPVIAMVGARASTSYGNSVATDLSFELTEAGFAIVSGGAYGIDAAAHRGALRIDVMETRTNQCPTLAILCGGLGNRYPAGNSRLFEQILRQGGGLVAEMPPSFRPARWRFLERNRLIAAWSSMVVVVEAGIRSGALATANRAAEIGVEVGAVPGPITSHASRGTNSLLSDGAAVITCAEDIVNAIRGFGTLDLGGDAAGAVDGSLQKLAGRTEPPPGSSGGLPENLGPLEIRAWDALPRVGASSTAQAAAECGLSVGEIEIGLLGLQSQGLVVRVRSGKWERNRPDTRVNGRPAKQRL